jgi:hypothetical protein
VAEKHLLISTKNQALFPGFEGGNIGVMRG